MHLNIYNRRPAAVFYCVLFLFFLTFAQTYSLLDDKIDIPPLLCLYVVTKLA